MIKSLYKTNFLYSLQLIVSKHVLIMRKNEDNALT